MSVYDAIVIGAGSVGVPTSYSLAKEGLKVMCIDKRASAGQGQNKAAIGGVRATHSDPAKIRLCQESLRIFSAWKEETGTDIGWKQGGYCFPVYREEDAQLMQAILPLQKKFDLNIDWAGDAEIARFVPGLNREGLVGGTYSPEDGQVSPLLAVESFADEARKLGAEFSFREQVQSLIMDENAVVGVKTDKGEYRAPVVVNAAGARATEICNMAGLDIQVQPDSHEAGITAPVKPFLDPLVVDIRPGPEGKTANFYFGQVESGQVIFCYTPKTFFYGEDRRCTSEFMPIIARRLVDLIPRLKGLMVRRLWRGLYPMTTDGIPIVGAAPKIEGLYLAIGMCGQGFMMGPGVGANLASLITKGKPLMRPTTFEFLRPDRSFQGEEAERLA
ncbi:MAG: sulfurtransferase [Candidatus Proteinoplasmatales archaeon SG8-5]|nr:MAG: sulfurtransferase [Candidatus Proteinoplasmatales archaeon SG8-5]